MYLHRKIHGGSRVVFVEEVISLTAHRIVFVCKIFHHKCPCDEDDIVNSVSITSNALSANSGSFGKTVVHVWLTTPDEIL
ncbi:hypothetical protein CEXT_771511 [Caerostris extrusa]|uniref:Uncharacterized protein n=1 Tax=Caerostris extrusa TaxID=172846 RepID=A0AAV4RMF4_CAEEX|nr:hypothetical protein CEXT_771511 [Caerostris extrusa]